MCAHSGGRRFSEGTSADREIQRTLMEVCIQSKLQSVYRSWKVIKIKIEISEAWKFMESGLDHGMSLKIMVAAAFLTHCACF